MEHTHRHVHTCSCVNNGKRPSLPCCQTIADDEETRCLRESCGSLVSSLISKMVKVTLCPTSEPKAALLFVVILKSNLIPTTRQRFSSLNAATVSGKLSLCVTTGLTGCVNNVSVSYHRDDLCCFNVSYCKIAASLHQCY